MSVTFNVFFLVCLFYSARLQSGKVNSSERPGVTGERWRHRLTLLPYAVTSVVVVGLLGTVLVVKLLINLVKAYL